MQELCYTLLSDGSSDRALLPILNWLLKSHLKDYAIQPQWADLYRLRPSLKDTFAKRIKLSLELYPCDLLFIHRDAEKEPLQTRINEIQAAIAQVKTSISIPTVCVVPIRMTEAWLLFDISALRKAASNPNGKSSLSMPDLKKIEDETNPKKVLHQLLCQASELSPRRLKKFRVREATHRVAELIDDFSPLRILPAFSALEIELQEVINFNFGKLTT